MFSSSFCVWQPGLGKYFVVHQTRIAVLCNDLNGGWTSCLLDMNPY